MLNPTSLIFEVTRWCNMECPHCLRGEREKVHLSKRVIDAALDQVGSASDILFTGGEPSIVPGIIEYILYGVRRRQIEIQSFGIVTNAKIATEKLFEVLRLWRNYTFDNPYISISLDQYHDIVSQQNVWKWRDFADEMGVSVNLRGKITHLIGNGRAYYMGADRSAKDEKVEFGDDLCAPGTLYIGATGNVLLGCDYSFEDQEEVRICTVFDDIEAAIREKLCQPSLP